MLRENNKREIFFVTSNVHKFEEVKDILGDVCKLRHLNVPLLEIQSKNFESVVIHKLSQVIALYPERDIIVEDSGVIIDAMSKSIAFPGVYSKDILECLGLENILLIMRNENRRGAKMVCYVGYYNSKEKSIKIFSGEVKGEISREIRGERGFGYDPIFVPCGYKKTFAEDYDLKKKISHRSKAFKKLKEHLEKNI